MMKRKTINLIFIMILLLFGANELCLAGGGSLSTTLGSTTLARNGLYMAGMDGVSAAYNNPAAFIYMSGFGVDANVVNRKARQQFTHPQNGLYRSFARDDIMLTGGAFWAPTSSLAFAVSAFRAVDFKPEWPFATMNQKEIGRASCRERVYCEV